MQHSGGLQLLQEAIMPKRYHKSLSSRIKGLERHEEMEHGSAFYEGAEERYSQEYKDGAMIGDDRTSYANMPQQVIMREYPKTYGAAYPELNDTMGGVDKSNEMDARKTKHDKFPSKY